ncbi:conserved protein of unknown function [Limnospira indica PCC 8005]|uniref:Uncharacterized protein n=1 Tax=Limnospira indica PCC 8005 TaxID=376219 RepID=A0A9P1KCK4_9CYAN|nr:conserved protein of unknown function [Limnospira indica PCC 8005]
MATGPEDGTPQDTDKLKAQVVEKKTLIQVN